MKNVNPDGAEKFVRTNSGGINFEMPSHSLSGLGYLEAPGGTRRAKCRALPSRRGEFLQHFSS